MRPPNWNIRDNAIYYYTKLKRNIRDRATHNYMVLESWDKFKLLDKFHAIIIPYKLYSMNIQNYLLKLLSKTNTLLESLWNKLILGLTSLRAKTEPLLALFRPRFIVLAALKTALCFLIAIGLLILVRGGVPRYRYDFLTKIGWIKFLSLVLAVFLATLLLLLLL